MNTVPAICERLSPCEALLVTSEANRFYLTGFESSAGSVLLTKERAVFLIDFRYFEKAQKTVISCEVVLCEDRTAQVKALCRDQGVTTLYLETETVSIREYQQWQDALDFLTVSSDGAMDRQLRDLRSVKSPDELDHIREAQRLTDETFDYILPRIQPGRTERDVMLDMEFYMRKLGSEGVSFDFIVVSGKNSSLPHGVPTDKAIERGDFLTMDFGAVVDGYHSDMTRTVAIGEVTDEQRRIYEIVRQAQEMAITAVKPGAVCRDIDKIARDHIYAAGYEGCFGHGLGHSVGVEIHEWPNFNSRCDTILKPGVVMTVEPGIYLPDRYGVRIEDMVFVTEIGCEDITKSPKELIVV